MTLKDHFLSQCPHDLKLLRLLYIKWQNQNSSTADNSESVCPDLHLSPTNQTHQSIEPFDMDSVHKMRQRERSQNSELYESRIEILGSSLFLQSVLAKLQRQTETETEREKKNTHRDKETLPDRQRQTDRHRDRNRI